MFNNLLSFFFPAASMGIYYVPPKPKAVYVPAPQLTVLLQHLQNHGSISQAEAGTVYRIRALPRRISDLRELGYKIKSELKKDATGQRYARYSLLTLESNLNHHAA